MAHIVAERIKEKNAINYLHKNITKYEKVLGGKGPYL